MIWSSCVKSEFEKFATHISTDPYISQISHLEVDDPNFDNNLRKSRFRHELIALTSLSIPPVLESREMMHKARIIDILVSPYRNDWESQPYGIMSN